jgi:hypothetical protein
MPEGSNNKALRLTAAALIMAAIAGAMWWAGARRAEAGIDTPAMCILCHTETTVKVGDTPGDEVWPRTCARCGQKGVYLYLRCSACGKTFPLKDPAAERFGYPSQCPHCRHEGVRGT